MNELSQLESNLVQIDAQREIVLDQIAELVQIETNKKNDTYSYLIGKCFKLNDFKECYFKVLNIVRLTQRKDIDIKTIFRRPNEIYQHDIYFDSKSVTEISLEQFESILKQTFDNILNSK